MEALYHTNDNEINKKYKGAPGGTRTWVTEGMKVDLPAYLTSEVYFQVAIRGFQLSLHGLGP